MLVWLLLCAASFLARMQETTAPPKVTSIPACSQVVCRGKRFAHTNLQLFQFCVPRGMKFRKTVGFEGDIHDRITIRVHGELSELLIFTANPTWGPVKTRSEHWPSATSK